jgi:hypothetical protein
LKFFLEAPLLTLPVSFEHACPNEAVLTKKQKKNFFKKLLKISMLEDDRGWKGLRLDSSGKVFGFGQASFDSCYGSDVENEAARQNDFSRQNLKLALDVVVSADDRGFDFASDDDEDSDGRVVNRRQLADDNIFGLIVDSNQSGNLFQNSSGKKNISKPIVLAGVATHRQGWRILFICFFYDRL